MRWIEPDSVLDPERLSRGIGVELHRYFETLPCRAGVQPDVGKRNRRDDFDGIGGFVRIKPDGIVGIRDSFDLFAFRPTLDRKSTRLNSSHGS